MDRQRQVKPVSAAVVPSSPRQLLRGRRLDDLANPRSLSTHGSQSRRLTQAHAALLGARQLVTSSIQLKVGNDRPVRYLVNPPAGDKSRKYPIAFIVHGGPS